MMIAICASPYRTCSIAGMRNSLEYPRKWACNGLWICAGPFLPEFGIGQHLDVNAANYGASAKADHLARYSVVPVGHRYTIGSPIDELINRINENLKVCGVLRERSCPYLPRIYHNALSVKVAGISEIWAIPQDDARLWSGWGGLDYRTFVELVALLLRSLGLRCFARVN
jgi:hypothetical protein